MDSWLLAQKAEIDAINAEILGMVAENQYRTSRDETIAYDEKAFLTKATELRGIAELIYRSRG